MGIRLETDLVMDVVRAAEPGRARKAASALGATAAIKFDAAIRQAKAATTSTAALKTDIVADALMGADSLAVEKFNQRFAAAELQPEAGSADARTSAQTQLEAFFLGRTLESVLPELDGGLFGAGTGSGIWRSMFADEVGKQMAAAVDILPAETAEDPV